MNTIEILAIIRDLTETYGYALIRLIKLSDTDRVLLYKLVKRGLIRRIERGKYVITDEGLEYLKKNSSYYTEI